MLYFDFILENHLFLYRMLRNIFSQLIEFLSQRVFYEIGRNKYIKHFTYWNKQLVMMFGQLSIQDCLRDLT